MPSIAAKIRFRTCTPREGDLKEELMQMGSVPAVAKQNSVARSLSAEHIWLRGTATRRPKTTRSHRELETKPFFVVFSELKPLRLRPLSSVGGVKALA